MKIAKCSVCSKEVSKVGRTYYETWEKKKDDFGLGRNRKIFCQNCWKEQEKNYRNYPCNAEEVKRRITKNEITENTSDSFASGGDYICYDPVKKEWVKEEEQNSTSSKNEPAEKGNDKWMSGILMVILIVVLFLCVGYWWYQRKKKSRKSLK